MMTMHDKNAWKYFTQLIPYNVMEKLGIDCYRAEPYAWVSNIIGPDNSQSGWGNVKHITGTAPWMDVATTQYLLGVCATLTGLLINPLLLQEKESLELKVIMGESDYYNKRVKYKQRIYL